MLRVRARRSSLSLFDRCSVLVFHTAVVLALIHSCRGQSEVIGLLQPVVASIGDDIILPCNLDPVMDAFDMTVEWARPDLDPRFVLVWRDGEDLESKKHPSYDRRSSLFTHELKNGNISLKISKVKLSDEGTYKCFVPQLDRYTTVQLVVGAASSPAAEVNRTISGVVLQCESAGWYPEPELLWLDSEGNLLSAGPTETLRGPDGLYTVSSRVTVEKKHSNKFTCRVQQKNINQSRETHIHVPDDFFMVISPSSPHTNPTSEPNVIIASAVGVAFVVVVLIVAVFFVWKWRRGKFKNKKMSEEEEAEQIREEKTINSKSVDSGFQVVVEGGESEPLITGREEENDVDSRVEQRHKYKRETKEDQFDLETEQTRDINSPQEKRIDPYVVIEKESLITTEQETCKEEEMTGREVETERSEDEGEKTIEAVKEDSDLQPSLLTEEHKEQPVLERETKSSNFNVPTDQEPHREKDTQQERPSESDVDIKQPNAKKKRTKKMDKQEKKKKKKEAQKQKQENQREELEAEQQREENQRKLQSETRTEGEKDETELNTQKDKHNQHGLEGNNTESSEAEPEDEKEKGRERYQRDEMEMTTRKAVEQRVQKENIISPGSSKVTERISLKIETEDQEKQQEEESHRSQEEIREQPEKLRRSESKEGSQGEVNTDEGVNTDETNKEEQPVDFGPTPDVDQKNIDSSILPSSSVYPIQGHEGAGADPSCLRARGGVHTGQFQMNIKKRKRKHSTDTEELQNVKRAHEKQYSDDEMQVDKANNGYAVVVQLDQEMKCHKYQEKLSVQEQKQECLKGNNDDQMDSEEQGQGEVSMEH